MPKDKPRQPSAGSAAQSPEAIASRAALARTPSSRVSAAHRAGIFAEGSRLGPYVLGPCVGYGESGRLYRAEHEAIFKPLALKVFTGDLAQSLAGRSRLLRDVGRAATVRHPSLVNIFDVGEEGDIPYVVMELLDGEDLDALLCTRGALQESAILDVMIPIVAGLGALHDLGVVHGGMTTKNIFLVYRSAREREPRLLDAAVPRAPAIEKLRTASGTRGVFREGSLYVAPETVERGELTALSDQYALGVVLYECAVGVNPFATATGRAAYQRIVQGDYPPLSRHECQPSEALARIVERAMSLEPQSRYPDVKALGRDLLLLSSGRTRMAWTLSLEASQPRQGDEPASRGFGASLRRRGPTEPWRSWSWRADWAMALVFVFAVVTLAWGLAILLLR